MLVEKNCPQCGSLLPPTALTCRSCNFNLLNSSSDAERIRCPKCGHFFVSGLTCPKCDFTFEGGKRIEEGSTKRQRELNMDRQSKKSGGTWGLAFRVAVWLILISSGISLIGWVLLSLTLN